LLERGPGRAQAIRFFGAPAGAAGKAAVELRFDQRDHVDAVDAQGTLAFEQERVVDVRPRHVDRAHHDAGQVSPVEPGAGDLGNSPVSIAEIPHLVERSAGRFRG